MTEEIIATEWYAWMTRRSDGRRADKPIRLSGYDEDEIRTALTNYREINRTCDFRPFKVETVRRVTEVDW